MIRRLLFTALILSMLCSQGIAIRHLNTWEEFIASSDFIVYARPTRIEEIGDKQYRTTFTIERIYKGVPPDVLSFDWIDNNDYIGGEYHFNMIDLSDQYLLFMRKDGDGYSLSSTRFMTKRKEIEGLLSPRREYVPLSPYYFSRFPSELEKRIVEEDSGSQPTRYLKWDDVKAWLDINFPQEAHDTSPHADGVEGSGE